MGCHTNISLTRFPKQGTWLGYRVEVCFHFDTSQTLMGTIVREDHEEPYETIIKLDDGRYVRAVECQYSPKRPSDDVSFGDGVPTSEGGAK